MLRLTLCCVCVFSLAFLNLKCDNLWDSFVLCVSARGTKLRKL
jgi:hypothetical protein